MREIKFPEILKEQLTKKGIRQADLARLIGYARTTVTQYIRGASEPNFETTIKIANVLGISLDELITGTTHENKATRENLNLSEKAIENLKILSQIDFFDELLQDIDFVEKIKNVVKRFELSVSAMRDSPKLVRTQDETLTLEDFFFEVESVAALELFKFFQDFFKQNNWVRNRQEPPKRAREQLERAKEIAKYVQHLYPPTNA